MAAQRHLGGGGEPAQIEIGVLANMRHDEGRLAEVILARNLLEHVIGKPHSERHHRRRIAAECAFRKGIDLGEGDAHQ